jgi:hypothetical protein
MRAAVFLACDIVKNRKEYDEINANPLDEWDDDDNGNNHNNRNK